MEQATLAPSPSCLTQSADDVEAYFCVISDRVRRKEFHWCDSRGNAWGAEEFAVNVYDLRVPLEVMDEICARFRAAGWAARHGAAHCGHGPYYALYLHDDPAFEKGTVSEGRKQA